jgi:hypothetical protein
MGAQAPRITGAIGKDAQGTAIEVALILVIAGLLAAIAGVLWLGPRIGSELEKSRALDQILSAPVPSVPGRTCGSLVYAASLANAASAEWEVIHQAAPGLYLITVTIRRGADSAVFHWTVDPNRRSISSLEKRSICQFP